MSNYRAILAITESQNFSDLTVKGEDGEEEPFNIGDQNKAEEEMTSTTQVDILLLHLLFNFTDRQKIILLYQILREAGYNLNHEDCAKTLSITREHYMFLLKGVKSKAKKIIQFEDV